jgi:hypothetical protein
MQEIFRFKKIKKIKKKLKNQKKIGTQNSKSKNKKDFFHLPLEKNLNAKLLKMKKEMNMKSV